VYRIRELETGIIRAAKIYFPHRDPDRRLSVRHAQKLDKLRQCSIVLQYHHSVDFVVDRQHTVALISELCDGMPLWAWVQEHPGKRLSPFVAMTVLYHLAVGLEDIHAMGEYHWDVHSENILILPHGIGFDLKLIDFYEWGKPTRSKMQQDIIDVVNVFHEILGGRRHYASLPLEAKQICLGQQGSKIVERYPTMTALRRHLEVFESVTRGWQ
jgi:serine/threonine protein kinase